MQKDNAIKKYKEIKKNTKKHEYEQIKIKRYATKKMYKRKKKAKEKEEIISKVNA